MFSQNTCWPTVPTFIMATGRSMLLNWCPILLHLHLFLFRPTRGNIRAVRVTSSPHICPSLPPSVSLHSITSIHLSYNPPISNSGVLSSSCVPTCVCILVCIYMCVYYMYVMLLTLVYKKHMRIQLDPKVWFSHKYMFRCQPVCPSGGLLAVLLSSGVSSCFLLHLVTPSFFSHISGVKRGVCSQINHFPEDADFDHDGAEYVLRKSIAATVGIWWMRMEPGNE